MNNIQKYSCVNLNTNYGQVNKSPNFKALYMPDKEKFMILGENCARELESIRPNLEQISKIYPDLDFYVKPNITGGGSLLTVGAMTRPHAWGYAYDELDINKAMQEAKKQSMNFGEYIIDMLKEFADAARNGAI